MTTKKIIFMFAAFFAVALAGWAEDKKLPLAIATKDYPHIQSIKNGSIEIPECRISYTTSSLVALEQGMDSGAAGDVVEVDFATYLKKFSKEETHNWALVPVYLWREFPQRHVKMKDAQITVDIPNASMLLWAEGIAASSAPLAMPIPDAKTVEQNYFRETRIFPIITVLAVRIELVKANPWLPEALFIAFTEAKSQALEADTLPLPWGPDSREETLELMQKNYWSYGVRNNPKTLNTLLKYAFDQALTTKELKPDDIFPSETLNLIDENGAKN